ncbi:hypothetical protein ACFOM8_02025 [Paracoccus angustae]|uniref:Phage minor structural protein GP20 n=1 Tax=Paracoccus angustae TaxID=1671480 RepID=A0ABV7TZT1_9RHOB
MALKTIIDNLDDVPEVLKAEYTEIDGKYVLDLEGIDGHPSVVNLKTAHERQKQANRTMQSELTAARARLEGLPDDFDADAFEALQQQAEGKPPQKTEEQVAQVRQQLEKKHSAELTKKDQRIAVLEGAVTKATIEDGISKALDEAGVDPAFKPGAMALLRSKGAVKLVEEDGQFKAQVETDMGPMPLANYVKDWSGSDEGKIYVKKATGGDALGGQGNRFTDNPWDSSNGKKPNLTKQQQIIQENPAKARQMAQAAGITPTW